jgi:hypothetical protein
MRQRCEYLENVELLKIRLTRSPSFSNPILSHLTSLNIENRVCV